MAALGVKCGGVTCENIAELLNSDVSVLFIGPEVIKQQSVTKMLLQFRSHFVCKVVDEAHLGEFGFLTFACFCPWDKYWNSKMVYICHRTILLIIFTIFDYFSCQLGIG